MSLVHKTYLAVIVDSKPPRAMIACKPYKCKLTLEACAKRAKLATAHRAGNLTGDNLLAVSACRECPVGLNTKQVMRALELPMSTRIKRPSLLQVLPEEGL